MAHILVAEDERDIRELINFTLMFAGHTVTLAANGEEAVEQAKKRWRMVKARPDHDGRADAQDDGLRSLPPVEAESTHSRIRRSCSCRQKGRTKKFRAA